MTATATLKLAYHGNRLQAAYLYLPRGDADRSAHVLRHRHGVVIDYAEDGRPIGIEFTAPSRFTLSLIDEALAAAYSNSSVERVAPIMIQPLHVLWLPKAWPRGANGNTARNPVLLTAAS